MKKLFESILLSMCMVLTLMPNTTMASSAITTIPNKAPLIDMVQIPAGTYELGGKNLKTTLTKGYYVGKYEVTQEEYQAVMGVNPSYFDGSEDGWVGNVWDEKLKAYVFDLVKSSDDAPKGTVPGEVQGKRPVENVSWYDAVVFCNKLSIMSNLTPVYSINGTTDPAMWGSVPESINAKWDAVKANWDADGYRLPTEVEWQIACTAGTSSYYSFGDKRDKANEYSWNIDNSSVFIFVVEFGYTHQVGKRLPNPWGLYDTYGNVGEWCWDWHIGSVFPTGLVDPVGPTADVSGSYRIIRGGSSGKIVNNSFERPLGRVAYIRDNLTGFRLVRNDNSSRVAAPLNPPGQQWEGYYLVQNPYKSLYKLGEGFDIRDLIVHYQDKYGYRKKIDNSELSFFTSGTVELTQGRPFTSEGVKDIEIRHKGKKVTWSQGKSSFEVKVVGKSAGDILDTGDYYMQIYGKYLYPVKVSRNFYLELSDKKPDKPFTIKLIDYSEDKGSRYSIAYDGGYIGQASSGDGDQLMSSQIPHMWRINKYSSFITIRDYGKQKLLVNASGQKSDKATKVIVWSSTGSAPDNGKITLIKD